MTPRDDIEACAARWVLRREEPGWSAADQKALADTTFRSWLHHGGEHRGKGKKSKDGKAAAAPAASAPAQP